MMELLHQLRKNADPRLQIERFVVMAAAVPTRYLTSGTCLGTHLTHCGHVSQRVLRE